MILSNFERQNARGPGFPLDVHTYTSSVWLTAIKFGMATHVGFVRGQAPPSRGARLQPCLCLHLLTQNDQIRRGNMGRGVFWWV